MDAGFAGMLRPARWSLASILLSALACAAPTPERIVIAHVDGRPLTLARALDTFTGSHGGHGALVRGEPAVRELIGRIVERELLLSEAEALGIPDDPLVIEAVELRCMQRAIQRFWEREVDEQVAVTDEQVDEFYARTDQALRLSLIRVADREQALALHAQVVAGGDFGQLAQDHSDHESSAFGGGLAFVTRGQLDPELDGPAFALEQVGELSPVIETSSGFVFLRLDERVLNADRPSRDEALPQIRLVLENRATEERRAAVEQGLLDDAGAGWEAELLTRERLLAEDEGDAVVARCLDRTFTLGEFRELFDLDAVRAAGAAEVAEATQGVARQWALDLALDPAIERSGLMHEPEIEALRADARQEIVLGVLVRDYINAGVDPDEQAVAAYYEAHRDTEFTRPPEVHMAYVVLGSEDEANAILARSEAGEIFGDLAREVSLDRTSAAHGGRIGWIRPGQIHEEVERRAFALEPGAIDGPIHTDEGWFVIQVLERTEPFQVPYAMSRNTAARRLVNELRTEARREWVLKLRDRALIEVDEQGVADAVAWLESQAPVGDDPLEAPVPGADPQPAGPAGAGDVASGSSSGAVLGPLPPEPIAPVEEGAEP